MENGQQLNRRPMQKVQVRKAAELVANQIRSAIVRGEIKTGESLPSEINLISTFEVSRPTLREAIRILESEELITVSRGARGGAEVRGPASELSARTIGMTLQARRATLHDIYEARAVFEPAAARLAAERRSPESVDKLRMHIEREKGLLLDRPRLASAMAEFHRLMVEQSGNKTLSLLAEALHHIVEKHNSLVYKNNQSEDPEFLKNRAQIGLRSQQKLVNLIDASDAAGAEAHWRSHMEKTGEFWLSGSAKLTLLDVLD